MLCLAPYKMGVYGSRRASDPTRQGFESPYLHLDSISIAKNGDARKEKYRYFPYGVAIFFLNYFLF